MKSAWLTHYGLSGLTNNLIILKTSSGLSFIFTVRWGSFQFWNDDSVREGHLATRSLPCQVPGFICANNSLVKVLEDWSHWLAFLWTKPALPSTLPYPGKGGGRVVEVFSVSRDLNRIKRIDRRSIEKCHIAFKNIAKWQGFHARSSFTPKKVLLFFFWGLNFGGLSSPAESLFTAAFQVDRWWLMSKRVRGDLLKWARGSSAHAWDNSDARPLSCSWWSPPSCPLSLEPHPLRDLVYPPLS